MTFWDTFAYWGAIACLLVGTFFIVTGAIGMIRFPDFFSRSHAASLMDSLGLPLTLLGLVLYFPLGLVTVKLLLLIWFAMTTSSTASHALAKAALISGPKPILDEACDSKQKVAK